MGVGSRSQKAAQTAPISERRRVSSEAIESVAGTLLAELRSREIDTLFSVTGGPLMPLLRAAKTARFPHVILCRHETAACLMAASYYHASGRLAAVALTSGPGAANSANGVVHALREQAALVLLTARPPIAKVGRGAVQDFDTARFFTAITKRSEQLYGTGSARTLVRELIELSLAPTPGPVNLTVCADQWDLGAGGES